MTEFYINYDYRKFIFIFLDEENIKKFMIYTYYDFVKTNTTFMFYNLRSRRHLNMSFPEQRD